VIYLIDRAQVNYVKRMLAIAFWALWGSKRKPSSSTWSWRRRL